MSDFQVPTHEFKTPVGGHVVVIKDFISGFDDEAIEAIYTRGRHKITPVDPEEAERLKAAGKEPAAGDMEIDGSAIQDAEREGVKRVVLSVDGNDYQGDKDKLLEAVYSMRKEDTRFVKKQVNLVINPKDDTPAKKK